MNIPGGDDIVRAFGDWPSFHDAEVIRFLLESNEPPGCGPSIVADIVVFQRTDHFHPDGAAVLPHRSLVSFLFTGVDQLALTDFGHQNMLWELSITDIRERQMESLKYEIHFSGSLGLDAKFLCRTVSVEGVRPWDGGQKRTLP